MKVSLPQHIYSCIRRDQSPRQVSGFQTLGVTREQISDRDVRAIEQRARYHITPSSPTKRMCYQLPSGSVAMGSICPIPDLDEHGRGGNFLMHTLVAPPGIWQSLAAGPFGVFQAEPFGCSLSKVLEEVTARTGDLAPLSVAVADEPWDYSSMLDSMGWSEQFILDLAHIVVLRQLPYERQLPIVVSGPSTLTMPLFALLMALIPSTERKGYSFDTYASGCRWSRDTFFWAVAGLAGTEIPRGAWVIDPKQQTVTLDPGSTREVTPYERWIKRSILGGERPMLLKYQQSALALSDALTNRTTSTVTVDTLPEQFVGGFVSANTQTLIEYAIGTLGFPPIDALRGVLEQRLAYLQPSQMLVFALGRDDSREVFDLVFDYVTRPEGRQARKAHAEHFVKHVGRRHPGLMLLGSCLTGNETLGQVALEACDASAYQRYVLPLVNQRLIAVWQAFTRKHAALWFDKLALHASADEVVTVAEHFKTDLDQFTPWVDNLRPEQQFALRDWLVKNRRRTRTLQQALEARVGRASTLLDHLRQRFTGNPLSGNQRRRRR